MKDSCSTTFDVIIVGGALSGAAAALILKRENPALRVLIVEKNDTFGRRVGEATVEVSTLFLGRVLGLTSHLNDKHLAKQGLRFWFSGAHSTPLDQCSEMGGKYMARVPSYQVDRAVLDEEVLQRAIKAGVELLRPARVQAVQLNEGGFQQVQVQRQHKPGEEPILQQYSARWVIDASGIAATLARKNGWLQANDEHPTTSVWARWRGVADWDGLDLAARFPRWAAIVHGLRGTATNHFNGPGWWAWCIPLAGGDVSIGIVFDERLVQFPGADEGSLGERLKSFLMQHGTAAEIIREAEPVAGDVHLRRNLPYFSNRIFGDGFALVGDAAGFIDPLYSPGMDWISYTVSKAVELILQERSSMVNISVVAGKPGDAGPFDQTVREADRKMIESYWKWFRAIYKDKYFYLGHYDLVKTAFILDLGFYYAGVASQPFRRGKKALLEPVFSTPPSVPFYHFISFYNRRLAAIGRLRLEQGRTSGLETRQRFLFQGYTFSVWSYRWILYAITWWIMIELKELHYRLLSRGKQSYPVEKPPDFEACQGVGNRASTIPPAAGASNTSPAMAGVSPEPLNQAQSSPLTTT